MAPDWVKVAKSWYRRSRILAGVVIVGGVIIWIGKVAGALDPIEKVIRSIFTSSREKALAELDARHIAAVPCSYLRSIERDRRDFVDLLLRAEVDPAQPCWGSAGDWTPLHWAGLHGNPDLIRRLLVRASTASPRDRWLRTPLEVAAGQGNLGAVQSFAEKVDLRGEEGGRALYEAVAARQAKVVKELLAQGAPVARAVGSGGWTALMAAVSNDDVPVVTLLLTAGADRKVSSASGQTALSLAQKKGNKTMIRLLTS